MSNNVRTKRKARGMSGEALARRAEMSASDLSKLERGRLYAYPGWRKRIAEALDTPEDQLFPGEAASA
jgi:transcriptional regulator with XRE-family HTH domain